MAVRQTPNRLLQLAGLATIGFVFFGGIFTPLQSCREAVFRVWLLGTQRAFSGVVWLVALILVPTVVSHWGILPMEPATSVAWLAIGWLISVLPFLLYRATSQRRPDFLSTLVLPLWGVAFQLLAQHVLPVDILPLYSFAEPVSENVILAHAADLLASMTVTFLVYWFAAALLWMWDLEFKFSKIAGGAGIFGGVFALMMGYALFPRTAPERLAATPSNPDIAWLCAVAALMLSGWSLLQSHRRRREWASRTETITLLRNPNTGEPVRVDGQGDHACLVSPSGERFPIVDGIPVFTAPDKISGSNRKYNRLYRILAGFYDDIQRVTCLLRGTTRYQYAMTYLGGLEVRPGHTVLETSVGTGLNFQCFPRGVKLLGLDLSAEMLLKCRQNLIRWDIEADLFVGNAEELPFTDESVDVVFHTGGINFFNDRAKAIREMIRVAKPGSRILIADETEEHVTGIYEKTPLIGRYFRNRQQAVIAPVDLVPQQMEEVHVELLRGGRFYVLTFRKPIRSPMLAQMSGGPR
jgi:ubiquinone/menaquinone biosynthesis C-methylase UbiE